MNLIAAVDRHWAIGRNGQLLVSIPQDQKRFREMTLGKVIVMGRKTFESLPGGQPLYGRVNLVLTKNPDYKVRGAVTVHSADEAFEALKGYDPEDVYIIGGETVYSQFLPHCDTAYVTFIDFAYAADAHFPDLEEMEEWELAEESDEQTYFDLCYTYRTYKKR